ncbi:WIYLD domain [Dillenia turbinata]|uniref:WIYLD domain n=1 Tax=Dillenia turbinata TaxID=194707 RepID=A0AAN8Z910_9MAGN
MAPRGRPRKVGLRRMDAAIDAMKPFGFPKAVVEKTVKNLLKVYDGDAGWPFIEECSYKLLIETLLGPEDKEVDVLAQNEAVDQDDDLPQSEAADGDHAGPSSTAERSPAQELPGLTEELALTDFDKMYAPSPPSEGSLPGWKDIELDKSSQEAQVEDRIVNKTFDMNKTFDSDKVDADEEEEVNSRQVSPNMEQLPCLNNPPRRRPSYGWLGVENNDEDILILVPAPLGGARVRGNREKRRLSWDV